MNLSPTHRTTAGGTTRRTAGRLAAVLLLAGGLLAVPSGTPLAPTPAGAATTELNMVGTVNHANTGIYGLDSPAMPFSSPAFGDIRGDSTPELVVGNMDGSVQAFDPTTRAQLWSTALGNAAIQSSPALADLSGDGKADVVVGTMDGRVVLLDGPTGRVLRTFRQGAPLHCPPGVDCRADGFFATPSIADINGDGILDIIAPNYDHTVYAWSKTGGLLWRRYLEDTLWSSPVVADIDRDGKPEIILGGDIWAGNPLGKPEGGLIWVLRRDGSTYPGYPRSTPGQTVWSSPAVADLNKDGFPDIVVGTGSNWPDPRGRRVDAFTAKTGGNLPGWPVTVDGRVVGSPSIGDIDADGALEITFASDGGWVYAYEANGARKWRVCNAVSASSCAVGYATRGGATIADVDADGQQEVVSGLDKDLRVFDGRTGAVEASYRMAGVATLATGSSAAIAEVDGKAMIAQSTMYRVNGHGGPAAAGDLTKVYLFTTGHSLCRADWPQFQRDARRTGLYKAVHEQWAPFDCPAQFVRQQYLDFLGRGADTSGTTYWTSRLHAGTSSGSTVIRSFLGSSEFGGVVAPVVRAHLGVMGTYPPTKAWVNDAVASLRQGVPIAEIADRIANDDPTVDSMSDSDFVKRVYRNVYKREATPSEVTAGVNRLGGSTTRGQLVTGFSETDPGAGRLAPEVNVAMVYLGMLGRAPDPTGWSYWVPKARTSSVDALVVGFQRSPEYARRVG